MLCTLQYRLSATGEVGVVVWDSTSYIDGRSHLCLCRTSGTPNPIPSNPRRQTFRTVCDKQHRLGREGLRRRIRDWSRTELSRGNLVGRNVIVRQIDWLKQATPAGGKVIMPLALVYLERYSQPYSLPHVSAILLEMFYDGGGTG